MQENYSDCSMVAQHALVLGPSGHVKQDPFVPAQTAQPVDSAIQPDPSQECVSLNLHSWLIEAQLSRSRASLRQ